MNNPDWSKAPEDATHTNRIGNTWFKFAADGTAFYCSGSDKWIRNCCNFSDYDTPGELIERPLAATDPQELPVELAQLGVFFNPGPYQPHTHSEVISLRDYFAVKAMQGYFSRPELLHEVGNDTNLAKEAYALADAMLAERAK